MSVIVFDHPLSPYGQKVKIALLEKGISFEALMPDGIGTGLGVERFQAANPRGEVPVLIHGDDAISGAVFDSTIILEYIEDQWPEPALLPKGGMERARVRMLEEAMDTHFEAIIWGLSEIRFFGRGSIDAVDELEASAVTQLAGWYDWLTTQLGDQEWFNGEQFGWGDLSVVPFLNGAVRFGFEPTGLLSAWLERVNQRASVTEVRLSAEDNAFDRPDSDLDALKAAVAAGVFKREYRDHRLEWMIKSGGLSVVTDGLSKDNIRFTDVFT